MSAPTSPVTSRPEWVLADCPACQGTMKLRSSLVGKHAMLCPQCKAPIEIEFVREPSAAQLPPAPEPEAPPPTTESGQLPKPRKADRKPTGKGGKGKKLATPAVDVPTLPLTEVPAAPAPLVPTPRIAVEPATMILAPPPPAPRVDPTEPSAGSPGRMELPATRVRLPYTQVNPGSSSEGRVLPPEESKMNPEFLSKLRTIEAEPVTRYKVRKRVSADSLRVADWDSTNLEEIPEAEIAADEWLAPGPDVLPEELLSLDFLRDNEDEREPEEHETAESADGREMVRKKRTSRRKVITGVRLFFQRMSTTGRWSLLSLLLVIVVTSGWFIAKSFRARAIASATEASPARLEGLALEQSQRLRQLSIEDMIGAEKIVQKFIAADGWEAKSAFVRRPEEVIPLMKKWYQTHSAASITGERTDNMRKALVGNTYLVFMEMRLGEDLTSRFFAIEHIPGEKPEDLGTYLVDWETSVGYQPMELSEFRAKQPRDPVIFRVLVKPESYYNYGFEDKEKWVSYRLVYPGENDFEIYGYIPLGSELAAQMEKQLFTEASLVLELKYPETAVSRDQVLITRIVHPAWYKDRSDVRRVPGNHVTPTVAAP